MNLHLGPHFKEVTNLDLRGVFLVTSLDSKGITYKAVVRYIRLRPAIRG